VEEGGHQVPQVIVELTQQREIEMLAAGQPTVFRGGSTLVVDLAEPAIQYVISKDVNSEGRVRRTVEFLRGLVVNSAFALAQSTQREEPFALIHAGGGSRR
jgi:hypothetical protein